jgi:nucleoid DNA-binding protein
VRVTDAALAPAGPGGSAARDAARQAVLNSLVKGKHDMAKASAISSPMSKGQIVSELSASTGLSRKQAGQVLEELSGLIKRHIGKKGPGMFALPGLLKITTVKKKAVPARKGVNPFTGQEQMFKAKPARTVIKIRALKKMKDMV